MALKTLQVSSNLATRPGGSFGFSPPSSSSSSSSSSYKPKPPPLRPAVATGGSSRISAKKKRSAPKCRGASSPPHGCADDHEVVRSNTTEDDKQDHHHQTATEIPVVLFPSVPFPGATLRLQAFEFRYRIMMQTLLLLPDQDGAQFGIVYCSGHGDDESMADVGCLVRVIECERLTGDRFFLTCVGGDRFRVTGIVRTKPYVVARIQVLSTDDDRHSTDDDRLVQQVERHLRNVAALSEKLHLMTGLGVGLGLGDSRHLVRLQKTSAASFSFLVARMFIHDRLEQQTLLQVDDTAQRLTREGMYLERRSKYLAAVAAIKDAFQHLTCNEK